MIGSITANINNQDILIYNYMGFSTRYIDMKTLTRLIKATNISIYNSNNISRLQSDLASLHECPFKSTNFAKEYHLQNMTSV